MTALLRPVSSELAQETLRDLAAINIAWAVDVAPDASGALRSYDSFFDPHTLTGVADQVALALGGCELRVALSALQLGLAARLWCITLGGIARRRVLINLRELTWTDVRGSVRLSCAAPAGQTSDHPVDLIDAAFSSVVGDFLLPLHATIREIAPVAEELLWGNASSALAGVKRVAALPGLGDLADQLLLRSPLVGQMLAGRRSHTCCLFYRVPGGGLCGDCVFDVSPADSTRR